jgi:hypothetical protein
MRQIKRKVSQNEEKRSFGILQEMQDTDKNKAL